jgi:hypothetical protein
MLPTPTVEDFAEAAREFIAWVEGEPGEPGDEARTAQRHLARLYHLATFLREVEPEEKAQPPRHDGERRLDLQRTLQNPLSTWERTGPTQWDGGDGDKRVPNPRTGIGAPKNRPSKLIYFCPTSVLYRW